MISQTKSPVLHSHPRALADSQGASRMQNRAYLECAAKHGHSIAHIKKAGAEAPTLFTPRPDGDGQPVLLPVPARGPVPVLLPRLRGPVHPR